MFGDGNKKKQMLVAVLSSQKLPQGFCKFTENK